MNFNPNLKIAMLSGMLCFSLTSTAQFSNSMMRASSWKMQDDLLSGNTHDKWHSPERLEIAGGLNFTNLFVQGQYNIPNSTAEGDFDTKKFTKQVPLTTSYYYAAGYCYPISRFGEKSALGITVNVNVLFVASKDNIKVPLNVNDTLTGFGMVTCGLPLSIDYKVGGHARYDKAYPFMYSFGVGFNPMACFMNGSVTGTGYGLFDNIPFKLSPFVKAEVGYYFGAAWKLRVMYSFVNQIYRYEDYGERYNNIKYERKSLEYKGTVAMDPVLTVALCINPFAAMWEKYKD